MPKKTEKIPPHFIPREISWMSFNSRVLQEAARTDVPLLERLKFLAIYSNNLDEFYRVRVAILRRIAQLDKNRYKEVCAMSPGQILDEIHDIHLKNQTLFSQIYLEIRASLEREHIYIVDEKGLKEGHRAYIRDIFEKKIQQGLSPVLPQEKFFPQLEDDLIYLAVKLSDSKTKKSRFALVEIPTGELSRFYELPGSGHDRCIIFLDDIIRMNMDRIFSILDYDTYESYAIKITRDAEIDEDNDIGEGLLEKISKGIRNRKKGQPVRLAYDKEIPKDLLKFIIKGLRMDTADTMLPGGRYHNFRDFMKFPDFGHTELLNRKEPPVPIRVLDDVKSIFEVISHRDVYLHYPYHDFSYYIAFLREAALDPYVKTIKTTLYRVARESKVVRALINAARNGKRVTVVVEIRARFDEKANIYWSNKMQEAGIKVLFGQPNYKIHSKLTSIVRVKGKKTQTFTGISTGNFHEGNAGLYTDFTILSSNREIARDVENVFEYIESPLLTFPYKHLLVSPEGMRKGLYSLINKEIKNAKAGKAAYIYAKINNLVDAAMIDKLYAASQAGVEIKLLVRGMCSLKAGVKGLSDRIEVRSVVDHFLEHSRIFCFCNGDDPKYYISSADWMTRNLDYRIEVAAPLFDPMIKQELRVILEYGLRDNTNARIVDAQGSNAFYHPQGQPPFRSQTELFSHYRDHLPSDE